MGRHHKPSQTGRHLAAGAATAAMTLPMVAATTGAASAAPDSDWDRLVQCEASGNWSINTGNGYSGGLQFSPTTWATFRLNVPGAPASAHDATREQQIAVAEFVLQAQGWKAWPACSQKLSLSGAAEPGKRAQAPAPKAAAPKVAIARVHPLPGGRLTSSFGDGRGHAGIDFAAPIGTPVHAATDGKVTFAGWRGGYGNLVIVVAPDGTETRYAHLSAFGKRGTVSAGDVIGKVGSTGDSTGPHLHFEVRPGGGAAIDPAGWLPKAAPPKPAPKPKPAPPKATTQKHKVEAPAAKPSPAPKPKTVVPDGARFTPGGDGEYVVQAGDTLSHLALQHGTTVERLMELNRDIIEMPDWIFVGEKIHLR